MYSLTKKQSKLYSDLIKEYNNGDWPKLCNIERFIKIKLENCNDIWQYSNLERVLEYAENDY